MRSGMCEKVALMRSCRLPPSRFLTLCEMRGCRFAGVVGRPALLCARAVVPFPFDLARLRKPRHEYCNNWLALAASYRAQR